MTTDAPARPLRMERDALGFVAVRSRSARRIARLWRSYDGSWRVNTFPDQNLSVDELDQVRRFIEDTQ